MNADDMTAIADRIESRLRRGWRAMLRDARGSMSLRDVEGYLRSGDLTAFTEAVERAAEKFAAEAAAGYVQTAQRTARWLDANTPGMVRFDITNERSMRWMEEKTAEIVRDFVAEQRDVAVKVTQLARARGAGEKAIAQEVLDSIGLSPQHVDHVESFRRAAQSQDYASLLDRQLGDARFDRAIVNARVSKEPLDERRIERMLERYRANWVARRGEFVSEALGYEAAHAGQQEAIAQAVGASDLSAARVTQIWHTRGDHKVRESHRYMSGQRRKLGKPFKSGDGNLLMYPHDPNAPLSDTAGCRCTLEVVLAGATSKFVMGLGAELAY